VVFRVPDGQIEDIGTTFAVTVQNGQTQRVVVDEGAVLLRLNGMKEQRVTAPNTWVRPSGAAPAPAPAPAAEPAPVTGSAPVAGNEPAPSEVAPVEVPSQSSAVVTGDDQAAKVRSRTDTKAPKKAGAEETKLFKKATGAYRAGRNAEALALFDRFTALYPHSSRSEDVSYLRVLSLAKSGQATQAVSAGEDYLARFPSGFRRKEMEDFVKRAKP
jgi:TolA-binding protein